MRYAITCVIAFLVAFCVAYFGMLALRAMAHDAPASRKQPYGWTYDLSCCNVVDCRQLDKDEVEETDDGFIWRSKHSGKVHVYKIGTTQIRRSKDEFYHGCETNPLVNSQGGTVMESRPLCLYVPDRGI